jgi:outer membrane beta-barrel protein
MSRLISLAATLRVAALAALLPAAALAQTAPAPAAAPVAQASDTGGPAPSTDATAPAATAQGTDAAAQPAPAPQKKAKGPAPTTQQAQEEAGDTSELARDIGPLKDRIPPVTGHVFLMRHRFELTPMVGVSLRDAFYTKYLFGAELTYHFTEDLGVGARFAYAKPVVSGAAQICTNDGATRGCASPTEAQMDGRAPGKISMLGGLNLQWAPIYGKLSVVSETFLHFDLYALGGVEFVQYLGPGADGGVKKTAIGGDLGLGLRFFVNRWVTIRTELNDVLYSEEIEGSGKKLRNQLMFNLGVSLFFPMTFTEG